jgi:hypothetical protein
MMVLDVRAACGGLLWLCASSRVRVSANCVSTCTSTCPCSCCMSAVCVVDGAHMHTRVRGAWVSVCAAGQ